MLPLYYGYLIFQLYLVFGLFFKVSISASAVFFSVMVFIIWTFLPITGYLLARLLGGKSDNSPKVLFAIGLVIGLVEQAWFYFNVSIRDQSNLSTFIVFLLFFAVGFVSFSNKKIVKLTSPTA